MRAALTLLTGCLLIASCRSTAPQPTDPNDQRLLPDLVIKKITYQHPPFAPRVVIQRGGVYQPTYEFKLEIANVGNVSFDQPFLLSFSTSLIDYQNSLYSKQERFNETGAIIAPGKSISFSFVTQVEIQRAEVGFTTLPMRFLLNHEWGSSSPRPAASSEKELSYDNNTYELSMRLQLRR